MIAKIAEAFQFAEETEIENMMLESSCTDAVNFFFTAAGPTKIIVTLENRDYPLEYSNDVGDLLISNQKLVVYFKELTYVPDTAVYFMKTKKGGFSLELAISGST